ncbi:MAG: hypothetical protein ACK583_00705 [Cyanobacteriota bacterium]
MAVGLWLLAVDGWAPQAPRFRSLSSRTMERLPRHLPRPHGHRPDQ